MRGKGGEKSSIFLLQRFPALLVCLTPHTHLRGTFWHYPHFIDKETEAQGVVYALAPGESALPEPRGRRTGVRGGLPSTPPPHQAPSPAPLLQDPGSLVSRHTKGTPSPGQDPAPASVCSDPCGCFQNIGCRSELGAPDVRVSISF